jgi:hypothetical protein
MREQPQSSAKRPRIGHHALIGEPACDDTHSGAALDDNGAILCQRPGAGESVPCPTGGDRPGYTND